MRDTFSLEREAPSPESEKEKPKIESTINIELIVGELVVLVNKSRNNTLELRQEKHPTHLIHTYKESFVSLE